MWSDWICCVFDVDGAWLCWNVLERATDLILPLRRSNVTVWNHLCGDWDRHDNIEENFKGIVWNEKGRVMTLRPFSDVVIILQILTKDSRAGQWVSFVECLLWGLSLIYILHLSLSCHINSLVQDCSISSALAMEILQSCNKPSILGSMCFDRLC